MMAACILCGSCTNSQQPSHPSHPTDTLTELVRSRACHGPIAWRALMAWDQPTVPVCRTCFHQLRRIKPRRKDKQPLPLDAAVLQTVVPGTMRQQDSRTRERICAALRSPGNAYSRTFEALASLLEEEEEGMALDQEHHREIKTEEQEEEEGSSSSLVETPTANDEGTTGSARPAPAAMMMSGEETAAASAMMAMAAQSPPPSAPPTPAMPVATTRGRMETWWHYNLRTECFSHKAIARHVRRCGL